MACWGVDPMVYMRRGLGDSSVVFYGPWQCRGDKETLGVIWLASSNMQSIKLCRLDRPSPGAPSRVFSVARDSISMG